MKPNFNKRKQVRLPLPIAIILELGAIVFTLTLIAMFIAVSSFTFCNL
jgi:hypothetical protein